MKPLDMAVRVILSDKPTGVAYPNRDLYAWYLDYCQARTIPTASRSALGMAMKRYGAVNFLTNPDIGRCWYLPTPEEHANGVTVHLGTSCVSRP